jgi:hypothetical protein
MLVVLDGAKARHKAVKDVFAAAPRFSAARSTRSATWPTSCPESMRPSVRRAMSEAYESSDAKRGLRLLENLEAL